MHESKFANCKGEAGRVSVGDFKKLKQQTNMFQTMSHVQTHSLYASYAVSLEIAKTIKPFTDGSLVKWCVIEMAKAFVDDKLAEKLESVPLSHQTIQRRIIGMGEQVEKLMLSLVEERIYFSHCLDESTDQSNIAPLPGRNKLVSDTVGVINGFQNKLRIFKHSLEKNELTHFPSCEEILKEFKEQDKVVDFSDCSFEIQEVIEEFDSRFIEVEELKKVFYFLAIPSVLKLKSKNLMYNLNLCDLPNRSLLSDQTRQET
ncbi:hypothetical protein PR048_018062 [Dryococelus australis]|uniref:DUF4371 domain-containing protein n=1 Tax=Dryococelus australis TaxID=614101 RepID=A0ABQ9HB79_9NEOP|nr:hypothetical protein PR048_018062 [Dryococelus australis]